VNCIYTLVGIAILGVILRAVIEGIDEGDRQRAKSEEEKRQAWLQTPAGQEHQARIKQLEEQKAREREKQAEDHARSVWANWYQRSSFEQIGRMSGVEFEAFLARLLARQGYTDIQLTRATSDQGGDILAVSPSGEAVVVQAKRWAKPVGNKVVQEILGALLHYGSVQGIIITNNRFTRPAYQLAAKDKRVQLHDGNWLEAQLKAHFSEEVPEFSMEAFHALRIKFPQMERVGSIPAVAPRRYYRSYRRRKRWRRY
jgi:restriction endonuclease Mrr